MLTPVNKYVLCIYYLKKIHYITEIVKDNMESEFEFRNFICSQVNLVLFVLIIWFLISFCITIILIIKYRKYLMTHPALHHDSSTYIADQFVIENQCIYLLKPPISIHCTNSQISWVTMDPRCRRFLQLGKRIQNIIIGTLINEWLFTFIIFHYNPL